MIDLNNLNTKKKNVLDTKKSIEKVSGDRISHWLKYLSLIVLVIQNAGQVLLIRYATTKTNQKPFLKTVLVFFSEVLKLIASLILLTCSNWSIHKTVKDLHQHFINDFCDTIKVGIPALIYTLQNFLLYVSIENLDVGTYMVTYQLKILTTALFAVIMLKKRLLVLQWVSLIILSGGVAIVQLSANQKLAKNASSNLNISNFEFQVTTSVPNFFTKANDSIENSMAFFEKKQNSIIGLISVIIACFLSGFAGIYFEKILKGSDASIWLRNVQLAALSIPISFFMIIITNSHQIMQKKIFQGFNFLIWIIVVFQALSGLLVAIVIKYADNILKAFATSFAIIVSSVAAIFVFANHPKFLFNLGACLVIGAIVIYSIQCNIPKKNCFQNKNKKVIIEEEIFLQ